MGQALDGGGQWRLEPFGRADPALIAKNVRPGPVRKLLRAFLTGQTHGRFYLSRVGVALFDQAHGQAVSAEDQMNPGAVRKLPQHTADVFNKTAYVQRVIVEAFHHSFGRRTAGSGPLRVVGHAVPFFHAAERGGVGIVGIQGEQHNFIEWSGVA